MKIAAQIAIFIAFLTIGIAAALCILSYLFREKKTISRENNALGGLASWIVIGVPIFETESKGFSFADAVILGVLIYLGYLYFAYCGVLMGAGIIGGAFLILMCYSFHKSTKWSSGSPYAIEAREYATLCLGIMLFALLTVAYQVIMNHTSFFT